ncbi:DUF4177 domain-containing protein [Halodurantibacterium flavum]|uniref:DUF4177 domain-containing protein n=1 Tax=Halodurantibacterium flavum TaxID=1382802 RepID=A0ABW4S9Z9_9RHOB
MARYEYKVIPAPVRGAKLRGVRDERERFAQTISQVMNDMALQGWEYQRAETLPCEERKGLFKRETSYQNLLVFRRAQHDEAQDAVLSDTPRLKEPALERHSPAAEFREPQVQPVAPPPQAHGSAAPSPAAAAASLRPDAEDGRAPRLGPIRPARPAAKQATITPIQRIQPEGPTPRGE